MPGSDANNDDENGIDSDNEGDYGKENKRCRAYDESS